MLQTVILAGGLATRLWPDTKSIPKSMIMISGKPFIDWQLSLLKEKGIKKVLLCIGYLGEQIENFVRDGKKWNLEISYSYEGAELLGTGGALRKAFDKLENNFFLTYGDSYLPVNYLDIYESFIKSKQPALMTIYKNHNDFDKSNIAIENKKIKKYIKGSNDKDLIYIDYGLLVLSKSIITKISPNTVIDLSQPLQDLVTNGELASYEVNQRFYEIGSRNGIKMLETYFQQMQKV